MNDVKTEMFVGQHEFKFIEPDQVHFVLRGVFEEAHAEPYLDFIFSHGERCGGLLCSVYDLTNFTRIDARARTRIVTDVKRAYPYRALAVIGASFSMRTVVGMILTAGRRLAPNYFTFQHKFVSTIGEANTWFDELRRKRA